MCNSRRNDAMNASNLYMSTCRLVLKADYENQTTWSDLDKLLPSLRLELSCNVCGNLLRDSCTPTGSSCQHHVCKACLGSKKLLKPSCSWCRDYEMYSENKQLDIIIQCYRKLCSYIKLTPIYRKLIEVVNEGGPHDLIDLVHEVDEVKSYQNHLLNDSCKSFVPEVRPIDNCGVVNYVRNNSPSVLCTVNADDIYTKLENDSETQNENDFMYRTPSSYFNNEIETISEEPVSLSLEKQKPKSSFDGAPVLSPICGPIENVLTNEIAPTLSPVMPPVEQENSNLNEASAVIISVSDETKLPEVRELSVSSNYESETNSDSSSVSSISSPMQISPILPSHEESPNDAIQEHLSDFSLATSLATAAVLELHPSPDLIEAANVNVLDSLDDDGSYGDLADINLSSCPLTSIEDDSIKNEIISSISSSVFPLQSESTSSPLNQFSKDLCEFSEVSPKFEITNSNAISQISLPECSKYQYSACSDKIIDSHILTTNCTSLNQLSPIAESHLYSSAALNNFAHKSSNHIPIVCSTSSVICNSNTLSQPIQSNINFSQSSQFIRSNISPHVISTPLISSSIKTTLLSPTNVHPIVTSNDICHGVGIASHLVQNPVSSSQIVQASVLSNQVLQQSMTSHHIQKNVTANQLISKSLSSQHISPLSVASCHLGNPASLMVSPMVSHADLTRMFLTNPSTISSHQTFPTISSQKFCPTNTNPSNAAHTSASATIVSPSLSSNFLNILPAGTIFSANIENKKTDSEIHLKSTPILNNGSSMYSVMFSEGDSTKITIKRTPDNKTYITSNPNINKPQPIRSEHLTNMTIHNAHINQNLLKKPIKPKAKPKPKPKRKGCRCGNATPSPGKLTCCGQRCPCYVEAKACIECRCKGCRNPHRPGGKKVRPIIPHQANIQIHQIQPVHGRVIAPALKSSNNQVISIPINIQHQFQQQQVVSQGSILSSQNIVTSAPQTIRTLQAIHAVKAVQGISSVQSIMTNNQLLSVKECVLDNAIHSSATQDSIVPAANIISMKPIKVRLDSLPNQLLRNDKFSHSVDSDSDVDIDAC